MNILSKMKLFDDKYLIEFESCLAIVTTDDSGNIRRVALFGGETNKYNSSSDIENLISNTIRKTLDKQ